MQRVANEELFVVRNIGLYNEGKIACPLKQTGWVRGSPSGSVWTCIVTKNLQLLSGKLNIALLYGDCKHINVKAIT